ncbi:MAG: DNA-binding protein, partial [Natronomonas sp.]
GQYQPEAASALRETETPAYVAVVGKPRTYETEEGDVNVSLRPESITIVDAATRNRWVAETAERTLDRIEAFGGSASETTPEGGEAAVSDEYAAMAETQYAPDLAVYRDQVVKALEDLEADAEVAAEA